MPHSLTFETLRARRRARVLVSTVIAICVATGVLSVAAGVLRAASAQSEVLRGVVTCLPRDAGDTGIYSIADPISREITCALTRNGAVVDGGTVGHVSSR